MSIQTTLAKKFSAAGVRSLTSNPIVVTAISTGSLQVDQLTGIGGFPKGYISEVFGLHSSGKCLGKGVKIVMYDGTLRKVEDVRNGDVLMGPDSTPRRVMGVTSGTEEMFTISQTYGIAYQVNASHILSLKERLTGKICNIAVKDFISTTGLYQRNHRGYKVSVEFGEKKLEIDPYFLGLWLGDGNSGDVRITSVDSEVISYLEAYATTQDSWVTTTSSATRTNSYGIVKKRRSGNSLQGKLRTLQVVDNKHIPTIYRTGSIQQRLELLAGIIDSDGSLSNNRGYEVTQTRKELAEQIKFVADSLGLRTNLAEKKTTCQYKGTLVTGTAYRLLISGNISIIPVRIARKMCIYGPRKNDPRTSKITVSSDGVGEYFGFMLDKDGLFLLDDMTVTHNTTLCYAAIKEAQAAGKVGAYVDAEFSFNPKWAIQQGVDISDEKFIFAQPEVGEDAIDLVEELIRNAEEWNIGIIIVDSIPALVPRKQLSATTVENDFIASTANLMTKTMPRLRAIIAQANIALVFVNHLKTKIGMAWGDSRTRPGGTAVEFYSSLMLEVRKGDKLEDGQEMIGTTIKVVGYKNRFAPFSKSTIPEVKVFINGGINKTNELIQVAVDDGVVVKAGAWYKFNGENIGQGIEKTIARVESDAPLYDAILAAL